MNLYSKYTSRSRDRGKKRNYIFLKLNLISFLSFPFIVVEIELTIQNVPTPPFPEDYMGPWHKWKGTAKGHCHLSILASEILSLDPSH